MKLFGEEVKYTSTNSSLNIIQVENFDEIFFDVFEIELDNRKLQLEKISEHDGNPIVKVPILVDGVEEMFPFLLIKGKREIIFNENSPTLENDYVKNIPQDEVSDVIVEDSVEELYIPYESLETNKEILEQIERAKLEAELAINKSKQLKISKIREQNEKNDKIFRKFLEESREDLVNEFLEISNNLKKEIQKNSTQEYLEIEKTLDNRINIISDNLRNQLEENFDDASKIFDENVKSLVEELYSKTVYPKLENELNDIALQIVEKVGEIETVLDKKLETKAEKTLVEGVSKELTAIQKANIELNDNINKGVNKALSRAGNVKILVEKIDKEINEKISTELTNIENYFDERIQNIQEKTFDITEESRKYIIDLVYKSKSELLEEIRKIPVEKPVEYIIESNKKDPEKVNLDKLKKEYDTIIHNKFENYKTDLRKYISVYSGGGSVAVQFADGGTMNGNLLVVGSISASQYLGLPSNEVSGDYLPLSGGTVTGDVNITGRLSADVLKFDTTAGVGVGVGELAWNDVDGTLELGLKGGVTKTEIGQGLVTRVVNKTNPGVDLLRANYEVVVIGGAQGQRLSVKLAQANNDANSAGTLGIVAEDILKNQEGFIITVGLLKNRNTTGSLQGESWSDGDILYLSPIVAGRITNVKPQAPQHTIIIGYVEYAHSQNGKIYVKIDNGYEIDELHNVRITSVSANDVLKYNGTAGVWENSNTLTLSSISANRIFTNQLDALSANITVVDIKQYELSGFNVQGDFTIQGGVSASGSVTANNIVYKGGNTEGNALTIGTNDAQNLNFETNGSTRMTVTSAGNVGIGTTTPNERLTVSGNISASGSLSAGNIFTNGLPVATAVDPVRTTLTGNGSLSTFSINGATNLVNPSALIVAIDGVLQEPVVDYSVNNGTITFTDPLASGAKAVVISPSNALVAGQIVPSDGSVTSAKIATGVTLTNPTINGASMVGPVNLTGQDDSTPDRVMSRALVDARSLRQMHRIINLSGNPASIAINGGQIASSGFDGDVLRVEPGNTTPRPSITRGRAITANPAAGATNTVLPVQIAFLAFIGISNNGLTRFRFFHGGANNITPPFSDQQPITGRGFGLECYWSIANNRYELSMFAHNGTTYVSSDGLSGRPSPLIVPSLGSYGPHYIIIGLDALGAVTLWLSATREPPSLTPSMVLQGGPTSGSYATSGAVVWTLAGPSSGTAGAISDVRVVSREMLLNP